MEDKVKQIIDQAIKDAYESGRQSGIVEEKLRVLRENQKKLMEEMNYVSRNQNRA